LRPIPQPAPRQATTDVRRQSHRTNPPPPAKGSTDTSNFARRSFVSSVCYSTSAIVPSAGPQTASMATTVPQGEPFGSTSSTAATMTARTPVACMPAASCATIRNVPSRIAQSAAIPASTWRVPGCSPLEFPTLSKSLRAWLWCSRACLAA
jgi:hypothetical protein